MSGVSRETQLAEQFGATEGMQQFATLLATKAVDRGLIGPREVPRLWSRHLANCAVVAQEGLELLPNGCQVADVGSGAGLPGIVWAITRPDLRVTLIEPLLRREVFLREVVADLGLDERVSVLRSRAEDVPSQTTFEVVTARAVARLPKLLTWTLPLVGPGGRLLALKGESASDEIAQVPPGSLPRGVGPIAIKKFGVGVVDPPTTVVVLYRRV